MILDKGPVGATTLDDLTFLEELVVGSGDAGEMTSNLILPGSRGCLLSGVSWTKECGLSQW